MKKVGKKMLRAVIVTGLIVLVVPALPFFCLSCWYYHLDENGTI